MDTQNLLKCLHPILLNVDDYRALNWNFSKVTSPFTRLYLVKKGHASIIHKKEKHELKPNHLYLIPSFTLFDCQSESFLDHFYIHFLPQITGGPDLFSLLEFKFELEASETDFQLMKRILELNPCRKLTHIDPVKYSKNDLLPNESILTKSTQVANDMETFGILLQLFSRFINNEVQSKSGLNSDQKISQAIKYIHKNLFKPIRLNELSELCNLSNDYFSRLFLKTVGAGPIDYINRKRIEEAQLQLITSNSLIEKIAIDVGIDNFSYFNRMFKKYSCVTPGEYRRLHRLV